MVGLEIGATDGDIGHLDDLYFDDEAWVIRYLVVETGTWLSNRKVLLSPAVVSESRRMLEKLPTRLSCDQVRDSPGIDMDQPVSRQHELDLSRHYGYPQYLLAQVGRNHSPFGDGEHRGGDPHLRSCRAVTGYAIHALDGDIGHVQGMLLDEESWAIRYLIVEAGHWWSGHQVLIAPEWITDVGWLDRKVMLDLTRQAVQEAPLYDASTVAGAHLGNPGLRELRA
jgi:uncharacterized protein YrrD